DRAGRRHPPWPTSPAPPAGTSVARVEARRRRRFDTGVMAAGSIGVGLLALFGVTQAVGEERIERYWTVAEVGADGGGRVTEVVDYNFAGERGKHGIRRWVPGAEPDSVSVSSPDAPDDVTVDLRPGGDPEIRIGDPDETVSGRARYLIDHDRLGLSPDAPDDVTVDLRRGGDTEIRIGDRDETVSGRVRYGIDYDLPGIRQGEVVEWETFGHEWTVPIEEAEVHLVTPFELDQPACYV